MELVQHKGQSLTPQASQNLTYSENIGSQRAIQEVQAAYIMAKKFPRNESECLVKIVNACKRRRLAETAIYSYPRGGQNVSGPSIRLAEAIAKYWGNMKCGFKVLASDEHQSLVLAYCIDLETNMSKEIDFVVEHYRVSKKAGKQQLTDPRDIYEMVSNQASRRVRNCILAIIPDDIKEEAQEVCERTLMNADGNIPIADRIKKMVLVFAEFNVSPAMIEAKLGHKIEATTVQELVTLQKIYVAIKDGFAPVTAYFEQPKRDAAAALDTTPVEIFDLENKAQVESVTATLIKLGITDSEMRETILKDMNGKDLNAELLALAGK